MADSSTSPAVDNQAESKAQPSDEPIVQYILLRTDLDWGKGAMIAQACHASVAAIAKTLGRPNTAQYLDNLANMHKVILRTPNGDDLSQVASQLVEAKIDHHLWIERPENVATCLASAPQPKSVLRSIFGQFKLLR